MPFTRRALLGRAAAAAAAPALARGKAAGALLPREDEPAAGRATPRAEPAASPLRLPPLPPGSRPFAPGEVLRYAVTFQGFTAGEATLAVLGPATIGPQSGLLVRYTADSRGIVAAFYRLHDRVEALLDPLFLFTRRYESWIEQGRRRRHRIVTFDPAAKRYVRTEEGGDTTTGPLDRDVVDGLGLVYHLRVKPLQAGARLTVPVFRRREAALVTLGAAGPVTVSTPAGRFETLEVKPAAPEGPRPRASGDDGGLLGGTATIWFTTDPRRIPVRLAGSGKAGSIEARLTAIELPTVRAGEGKIP
jgi:hypothetical protein